MSRVTVLATGTVEGQRSPADTAAFSLRGLFPHLTSLMIYEKQIKVQRSGLHPAMSDPGSENGANAVLYLVTGWVGSPVRIHFFMLSPLT